MSNAINFHGTIQTRTNGIGSALRCVMAVAREMRGGLLHKRPGKPLHAAHQLYALSSVSSSSASVSPTTTTTGETAAWQRPSMPRPVEPVVARATAADVDLPAAVWATLVVVRAASA